MDRTTPVNTFEAWWRETGQFVDPDASDVPWFDKRRGLAEIAFSAGHDRHLASTPSAERTPSQGWEPKTLGIVENLHIAAEWIDDLAEMNGGKGAWPALTARLRELADDQVAEAAPPPSIEVSTWNAALAAAFTAVFSIEGAMNQGAVAALNEALIRIRALLKPTGGETAPAHPGSAKP